MKLFRKYLIIFSISYLSVNYAFSTNVTSELNYYKKINLPYSSNELKKYYYWGEYGLYLSPAMPFPLRFTNKEFSYKPKLFDYLAKTTFYFPHCYFYYKNILYKGVIQMATGENDGKVFTFQLYSYDNQGVVIDAILLYKVEGGEISYWNDFIINPNGKILITQYQQENLFEDDEEPKNNQIDTKTVEFQMTPSGIFNPTKE
ncbi:hypothetical protein B5800_13635 [Gilliamella apicola]|uniref:hypothetical protein n=3 Tax=Gilliamella apicola TaxID=1196095 RepID=UPI000A053E3B|nr:hypothetical protein [Gilliamella apicola]ORF43513.1 hypothetical protein B5800_13635 [Gilliamella apicola]ORF47130.1 hypothetical protein B5799_13630 [Gilliamella apicola]ORF49525.1 hypothetical protein B5802_13075 [Gilliamella apicola]ORF56965.1 hypothetical protein B5804_13560 [Gilliamella apicola]ORF62580.1 hypothetical protein B5801_02000 [Gilliamella apicola]